MDLLDRSIDFVDFGTMTVALNNGDRIPITNMLDDEGDECLSPYDAVALVAGDSTVGWCSIDMSELVEMSEH